MSNPTNELKLADKPSINKIPAPLWPIIDDVIILYKDIFGANLHSVYIHGSASRGDWQFGKSDLDTLAVVKDPIVKSQRIKLKKQSQVIIQHQTIVSSIEIDAVGKSWLTAQTYESNIANIKLLPTAVCIWGEAIDFMQNLPNIHIVFGQYADRSQQRVLSYRAQSIAPLLSQEDGFAMTRRYAKQAVRVLNLIAVLRGAALHTSIPLQLVAIKQGVPEAEGSRLQLQKLVTGKVNDVDGAVDLLEEAVNLYATYYTLSGPKKDPQA